MQLYSNIIKCIYKVMGEILKHFLVYKQIKSLNYDYILILV